jgi:hypothetical protein
MGGGDAMSVHVQTNELSRATGFLSLMQRYVVEYVNLQCPITEELMVPNYYLRAGDMELRSRADEYVPMVAPLLEKFPKLSILVHDVIVNGDRYAMSYSEMAREAQSGHLAVWGGIGLYKWDGTRLTANVTEQDWLGRDRQLATGQPDGVREAAISPWETAAQSPDPETESVVRSWLNTGEFTTTKGVLVDDEAAGQVVPRILEQESLTEVDLFSAGNATAFYVVQRGGLLADFAPDARHVGRAVELTVAGIVRVSGGRVVRGTLMRNRAGLLERLAT